MADKHPHFCDCDDCLNSGGGLVLADAGRVRPATEAEKRRARRNLGSIMRERSARYARLIAEAKSAFDVEVAAE